MRGSRRLRRGGLLTCSSSLCYAHSEAEHLYHKLGWRAFGSVPDYASDPDGTLADCVFFFKRCGEDSR
jgi:hypothetical protein